MLAGLSLSLWLGRNDAYDWLMTHFPAWQTALRRTNAALAWMAPPSSADCFRIAALLSFALSSFCVFLPNTPPVRAPRGTIAPLQTLAMFKRQTFTLLIAVSFLLSIVVPLYTLEVPKLLEQLGYDSNWIPAVMTIGQISEFPALLLLPFCLKRFGLKTTFALGMGAWLVRYLLFTLEQPAWPILLGIAFHGVCHVFLIIVIQLYVDSVCRSDLRASAQNLFAFITMGIGMPLGFYLGGKLAHLCRDAQTGRTNYDIFFSAPAAVILVLLLIYWRWFQVEADGRAAAKMEPVEPRTEAVSNRVG
jgi:predicted MFS family arabinose efflux permease